MRTVLNRDEQVPIHLEADNCGGWKLWQPSPVRLPVPTLRFRASRKILLIAGQLGGSTGTRARRVKKHLIVAFGLFLVITELLLAQTDTGVNPRDRSGRYWCRSD